ncbi:hypothetical protein Ae263Ps1_2544c [Pseudonocardia sp. Ae263_Ps1]|nr:hypothetical protein Ae150APs1_2782 [Pseudonocardia sp. Ae150A_Ps1]OLL85489.1 hypothetical protein Ae263Ps1_2544c [Pseudonocardia sp. Ae263_Ps1]OLL94484.1 hypothetical protein Ae356Ps1_4381 [Pseudonocardia sp. Ae356_Ps1]
MLDASGPGRPVTAIPTGEERHVRTDRPGPARRQKWLYGPRARRTAVDPPGRRCQPSELRQ